MHLTGIKCTSVYFIYLLKIDMYISFVEAILAADRQQQNCVVRVLSLYIITPL